MNLSAWKAKEGGTFPRASTVKSDIFVLCRADFNASVALDAAGSLIHQPPQAVFSLPRGLEIFLPPSFGQVQHRLLDFPSDLQTFRGREKGFNHSCSFCLLKQFCVPRAADLNKSCFHTHNASFPAGKVGRSRDFQLAASAVAPSS